MASSDYLDGIVAAVSRVGTLIITMGVISGLVLVVLYIDKFSVNDELYKTADSERDLLAKRTALYSYQIKSIDIYLTTKTVEEVKSLKAEALLEAGTFFRSGDRAMFPDKPLHYLLVHCPDDAEPTRCQSKLVEQFGVKGLKDSELLEKVALKCEKPNSNLLNCKQALVHQRSIANFQISRINNEMKLVNLGRVKLPFLGYEIATNDAPVVLGFFLVIIASVTVITVHHLRRALADDEIGAKVRENVGLLRSRLIYIYAPVSSRFYSVLTIATFFMPCLVMAAVAFDQLRQDVFEGELLRAEHVYGAAFVQGLLLLAIVAFLGYVGYSLNRGWRDIGNVLSQPSSPQPFVPY
jgi:hypothetical protein